MERNPEVQSPQGNATSGLGRERPSTGGAHELFFTPDRARVIAGLEAVRGSRGETAAGAMGSLRVSDAYEIVRGNQQVLDKYVNQAITSPGTVDAPATAERQSPRGEQDPKVLRVLITEDARTLVSRTDTESRQFLQTLGDVVGALRDLDGRKAVILFSEGFEIDNVRREVEEVARERTAATAAREAGGLIEAGVWYPGDPTMRSMKDFLTVHGVEVPAGWALISALGITPDGTTIVGQALNTAYEYGVFIVRTPEIVFDNGFEWGDTGGWSGVVGLAQ